LDVRAGGRFRIVFGGPDGKAHDVQGVYKEGRAEPQARLHVDRGRIARPSASP
jgi:uncharacterized protein YndB with AHSA1/START domain